MKKKFFNIIVTALACVAAAFVFAGCAGADEVREKRMTSYVSVSTRTYGSTAEVVKNVAASVVEIRTESVTTQWGMQYIVSGAGSGVIVAHEQDFGTYYIITNNHVISGARNITVSLRSGESYNAKLIATDVQGDIAVVSIDETKTLNVAVWGDSDELLIGEDVIAIGNPLGNLGGTVTKGIISATERSIAVGEYTMTLLQTDTAINPGNSGGGLFNMNGELIGIVNAKTSDEEVEGICFAIPANTARGIYDDLVQNGVVTGRVTLGVNVAAYGSEFVYVTELGSDVADGTFKLNDRIAYVGNKQVGSLLDYHDALAAIAPGEQVKVKVYRYRGMQFGGIFGNTPRFEDELTEFTVTAKQLGASK